jgi:hypothetical protein
MEEHEIILSAQRELDELKKENQKKVPKLNSDKEILERHILLADTAITIINDEFDEGMLTLQHQMQTKDNLLIETKEACDEEKRIAEDLLHKSELEKKKLREDLQVLKLRISEKEASLVNVISELDSKEKISDQMQRDLASTTRQSNQKDEKFNLENDLLQQRIETEKEELRNEILRKNDEIIKLKKLFILKANNQDVEWKVSAIGTEKKLDDLQQKVNTSEKYGQEVNKSYRDAMKISEVIKNALKKNKQDDNEILTPDQEFENEFLFDHLQDSSEMQAALKVKDIQLYELNQKLALYATNQMEIKTALIENQMARDHLLESLKSKEKQISLLSDTFVVQEAVIYKVYIYT